MCGDEDQSGIIFPWINLATHTRRLSSIFEPLEMDFVHVVT